MNLGIKHLSKNIKPDTVGIIWLTDDELSFASPGVYEFNYLLNGILFKTLETETEKNSNSSFFLGENFGEPLFVGHVVVKDKADIKKIDDHIRISESFFNEKSKVFIFNKSKNTANTNILKTLSEKYKNLNFENLNI